MNVLPKPVITTCQLITLMRLSTLSFNRTQKHVSIPPEPVQIQYKSPFTHSSLPRSDTLTLCSCASFRALLRSPIPDNQPTNQPSNQTTETGGFCFSSHLLSSSSALLCPRRLSLGGTYGHRMVRYQRPHLRRTRPPRANRAWTQPLSASSSPWTPPLPPLPRAWTALLPPRTQTPRTVR